MASHADRGRSRRHGRRSGLARDGKPPHQRGFLGSPYFRHRFAPETRGHCLVASRADRSRSRVTPERI